jgi:mRNA-degrading endonuclease RelE of RelBE toxin-antitoxin system
MIRIFLLKRFTSSVARLSAEQQKQLVEILRKVMDAFGDPRRHAGLGLRKLGPDYYECRFDIRLRIVFELRSNGLYAYDLMTHDQVRALLRSR